MYYTYSHYSSIISKYVPGFLYNVFCEDHLPLLVRNNKFNSKSHTICTPPGFIGPQNIECLVDFKNHCVSRGKINQCSDIYIQYLPNKKSDYLTEELATQMQVEYKPRSKYVLKLTESINEFIANCKRSTAQRLKAHFQASDFVLKEEYNGLFSNIYKGLSIEKNFKQTYCYTPTDLKAISDSEDIIPFSLYSATGEYLGGCIVGLTSNSTADYILSSVDKSFYNSRILILLLSVHLKKKGIDNLNLGGGTTERENDGLANFKQSFGADKIPWYGVHLKI